MALEIDNINLSGGFSATTISATTIVFGGQPIEQVFAQRVSGGYLPISGGTVTGGTNFSSLSATTLSGGTILSGGTNLYSIFSTTDTNDITRVQPGSNIATGGTANAPTVSLAASPSVNNITFSGTAIGGSVQAGAGTFTSLSATTLSGGTILSGGTNLQTTFNTINGQLSTKSNLSGATFTGGVIAFLDTSVYTSK